LRVLGLGETTAIVIGGILGSAIFIVPAEITLEVGSRPAALAVWTVAGLLSLFGALSYAELAAMLPKAGGQYVFLRETYGPLVAFLCGWMLFFATQSGAIATLAVGFAQYLAGLALISPGQQKVAAALVIIALTAINYRGVKQASRLELILTGLTLGVMVALVASGFALVHRSVPSLPLAPTPSAHGFVSSFGVAMIAALWAYEGWNAGSFFASEVKEPGRNLPLGLIFGTSTVVGIYLAANLVYYHLLDVPTIAHSPRVAADAAASVLGGVGYKLVSVVIIVAVFGCINSSILSAPRVYYAMAGDGLFFGWCRSIHPRFRTPHLALVAQAVWSIVLVALGTYEQLYTYVIFAAWIMYALTTFGVVVLRRKLPALPRPYRVFGYPLVPVVFVLAAIWLVGNLVIERPKEAAWGILIVGLGVPTYFFWKRKEAKE
jgi:APA family basic amino acid/polyamine antiporter